MSPQVTTGSVEAPLDSLYVSWKCGVVLLFIEHWLFIYKSIYLKKGGRKETPTVCVVLVPGTICRDLFILCFGLCIPAFLGFLDLILFYFCHRPLCSVFFSCYKDGSRGGKDQASVLLSCTQFTFALLLGGPGRSRGNRYWEAREEEKRMRGEAGWGDKREGQFCGKTMAVVQDRAWIGMLHRGPVLVCVELIEYSRRWSWALLSDSTVANDEDFV